MLRTTTTMSCDGLTFFVYGCPCGQAFYTLSEHLEHVMAVHRTPQEAPRLNGLTLPSARKENAAWT